MVLLLLIPIQVLVGKHSFIIFLLYIYIGDCKIEGDNDQWDFGEGAGYYIDATESKWSENYQMLILIELEFSGKENI